MYFTIYPAIIYKRYYLKGYKSSVKKEKTLSVNTKGGRERKIEMA